MLAYYFDLAWRSLAHNRVLTAPMVLAIGLGIGASMTALTVLHVPSRLPLSCLPVGAVALWLIGQLAVLGACRRGAAGRCDTLGIERCVAGRRWRPARRHDFEGCGAAGSSFWILARTLSSVCARLAICT